MRPNSLDQIMAELVAATGASRATLRLDDAERGWRVDDVAAEALQPEEHSLRGQTSIDQRAAATVRWLEEHRMTLVQDDVASAGVRPPDELIAHYGVRAQMLSPIVRGDELVGWVSVHETRRSRSWSDDDRSAIEAAALAVLDLLAR